MSSLEPELIRTAAVADVYKAGRRAAQLRRTRAGTEFLYLPSYLDTGVPVATTLPLSSEPQLTPAGAVPPYFAGLLPEGRRLSNLRRAIKTSADDELSLLLAVGRDPVGDVQVTPEGEVPGSADALVTVNSSFSEVRFADLLADAGIIDPVALPGVQDKVSARVISLPLAKAGDRYILKLDPPEYPHVVANEAYFMHVARAAGMPVADAEVVVDVDDRPGLLVRRFDRVAAGEGTSLSLACEDACQLLDRWPADKYNVTAEAVVASVGRVCAAAPLAVRDVFRQLCFAWITGNGDVHAKNISVLGTNGEWRVSPAYDLPSTLPYGDRSYALPVGGTSTGLSRRRLLAFAASVGLSEKAAARVLDGTLTATRDIIDELADGVLPFDQQTLKSTVGELRFRRRQMSP
ncbi:MAG: HipA domain-containing protein [Actinomycetota bacterium]|nr:HipA domain-containing protein [Actinomycetota bacterium]